MNAALRTDQKETYFRQRYFVGSTRNLSPWTVVLIAKSDRR